MIRSENIVKQDLRFQFWLPKLCPDKVRARFGRATMRSMTQGRVTYTMEPNHYEPMPNNIETEILETVNGAKR